MWYIITITNHWSNHTSNQDPIVPANTTNIKKWIWKWINARFGIVIKWLIFGWRLRRNGSSSWSKIWWLLRITNPNPIRPSICPQFSSSTHSDNGSPSGIPSLSLPYSATITPWVAIVLSQYTANSTNPSNPNPYRPTLPSPISSLTHSHNGSPTS